MAKNILTIIWALLFLKIGLFWLWLWQLKDYHFGRFKAHFETQAIKKLTSCVWRLKLPVLTKKMALLATLFFVCVVLLAVTLFFLNGFLFYFILFALLFIEPFLTGIFVLLFQIPTFILRKIIMKKAAQKMRQFQDLIVIGITGSYGKTSTKEFLSRILEKKYQVLKTPIHINSETGIAKLILEKLKKEYNVFVVEIGAYELGKIKEVCGMIKPKVGILTGINEQHLSTFGSLGNIKKAKRELIESLPQNGIAIFNGNNQYCRELYEKTTIKKVLAVPSLLGEDILELTKERVSPWETESLSLAIIASRELGLKDTEIKRVLEQIEKKPLLKTNRHGWEIFESIYSANPNGVLAHLDYFQKQPCRKIIIMPCLIELGKMSREIHRKIGRKISEVCDLAIITTKDRFRDLRDGFIESNKPENIILIEKPPAIFERVKTMARSGDIIILEGRLPKKLISLLTQ